jgi:putative endonuclease
LAERGTTGAGCGMVAPEVIAMKAKDQLGIDGEQVAADFLQTAGMEILARNWRCSEGEIDIVALDDRALVICEVKTRSSVRYGTPVEAVNRQKARRLRRLAVRWALEGSVLYQDIRIDVIGILLTATGEYEIEHVRGIG